MKNKNLIRFAQSLVVLPAITVSLSVSGIQNIEASHNVLAPKVNIDTQGILAMLAFGRVADDQGVKTEEDASVQILKDRENKILAIDAYFAKHNMPLEGTGRKMVEEAEKNDLDWRLLPAIAVRESTGGKNDCNKVKNNAFGWGSCKIGFKSNEEAIEVVARNLGGNNPKTAKHYDDKNTKQILRAYNPPSVVSKYAEQVMSIMDAIGDEKITTAKTLASAST